MHTELIAIGIIKRPVGLKGLCAVQPFGSTFAMLETPCQVRIGKDPAAAGVSVIEEIIERPGGYQCLFAEKYDRTLVEGLRGQVIYVGSESLPNLPQNAYYHFELEGMAVVSDTGGATIGRVIEVLNYPSMDSLAVKMADGEMVMLPFFDQAVAAVNRAEKMIVVRQSFVEDLIR